eukprot:5470573-Amphidinium_carterae.1
MALMHYHMFVLLIFWVTQHRERLNILNIATVLLNGHSGLNTLNMARAIVVESAIENTQQRRLNMATFSQGCLIQDHPLGLWAARIHRLMNGGTFSCKGVAFHALQLVQMTFLGCSLGRFLDFRFCASAPKKGVGCKTVQTQGPGKGWALQNPTTTSYKYC